MHNEYIYLATPYTLPKGEQEWRYRQALALSAAIINQGICVFCPILCSHEVDKALGGIDPAIWYSFDKPFIRHAGAVWVAMLEGWEDSRGIALEVGFAESLSIPLRYFPPTDYGVEPSLYHFKLRYRESHADEALNKGSHLHDNGGTARAGKSSPAGKVHTPSREEEARGGESQGHWPHLPKRYRERDEGNDS